MYNLNIHSVLLHSDLRLSDLETLFLCVTKARNELLLLFKKQRYLILVVIIDCLSKLLAERLDLLLELLLALLVLRIDAILVNDDAF